MKKMIISLSILLFIIASGATIYYLSFSLTAVLKESDFNKDDIIFSKVVHENSNDLTKMFVLDNTEKTGIIIATKDKFNLWRDKGTGQSIEDPSNGEFITSGMAFMDDPDNYLGSEKHVLLIVFSDKVTAYELLDSPNFRVELTPINKENKTMLVAHAISENTAESLGSDDVISFLQERFNIWD